MIKKIRAKLLKSGVSKELLDEFELAVRLDADAPLRKKLEWSEHRELDLSDAAAVWQEKYFAEKEKAERLELADSLRLARIQELEEHLANQSAQIKDLQKQLFGEVSERGAGAPAAGEEATEAQTKSKRGKKPGAPGCGRKHDKKLEKKIVNHDIPLKDTVCPCGGEYDFIDLPPKESHQTDIEERAFNLNHRRRTVMRRCRACGKKGSIKTAPKPVQIIPRGKYSINFWRFIFEEKYWLQRPLNRIKQKLASLGVEAGLGTLTSGLLFLHEARIFEVIYEALLERSRLASQRNMDDTGWKVFAESEGKLSNHWYMWVAVTQDVTVFVLDPRRSSEVIAEHLHGVAEGIIICDRHSSFKKFSKNSKFIVAFCWIHQRRDFIKLMEGYPTHSEWARNWLERIDVLMAQNKVRVAAMENPVQFKIQDDLLRSMVTQMKLDIDDQLKDEKLAKARRDELTSLVNHWTGLTVFVNNPLVPMDNNAAERALREAVLGRKSYYGSRAVWSGQLSSHLFSIFATLEQNNINPHEWLNDYLTACAENNGLPPPDKEIQKFLPWNYKPHPPPLTIDVPYPQEPPQTLTISLAPEPIPAKFKLVPPG